MGGKEPERRGKCQFKTWMVWLERKQTWRTWRTCQLGFQPAPPPSRIRTVDAQTFWVSLDAENTSELMADICQINM